MNILESSFFEFIDDELEPLFDYSRVQPRNIVCLDDDDDDGDIDYSKKKRKISQPVDKGKKKMNVIQVVDCEEDEDDWLPPPPKVSSDEQTMIGENSTLRELRLKKQELVSFTQSAKSLLKSVDESAKSEKCNSSQPSLEAVSGKTLKPPLERDKILISFQNKDGLKNIRVYMDDNFERIFRMYADNVKLNIKCLAFTFDGDKINPSETPSSLGMEDEDIIEVHVKSS